MIRNIRILRGGLIGAVCFVFCGGSFGLQMEAGSSCWLGSPEQPPAVTPVTSRTKSADVVEQSLELEFSGLQAVEVQTDQGNFARLSIPQTGVTVEPGHPELPVYRRELMLDPNGTYECRVTVLDEQTWSLRQLGLPLMPLPVRGPIPKVPGALEAATLKLDPSAYIDSSEKNSARLTEIGVSQGKKLFLLEIFPVEWDPSADSIRLRTCMRIDILRTDSGPSVLDGSADVLKETKGGADDRLLIISADELLSGLTAFVDHKAARGWDVDVVSVSDAGSSREALQDHIYARYLVDDLRPSHLLLVGDSDTIPVWPGQGPYLPDTDLYYACMDGGDDWLPDMAYGRFPARTPAQLSNMVQKVISYETSVSTLSGFVSNAAFAASSDNYSLTEGTHNTVIGRHMDPRSYVSDKLYSYTYGANGSDLLSRINTGCSLMTFSGHGYAYKWRDPEVQISDVYALSNGGKHPFVASFACDTGSFATMDECFAEAWLRTGADRGGVAFWSSSEDTYWDEDDILEKCLYDAVFIDNKITLGEIVHQAKQRYLAYYGNVSETLQYFEQYHLLGDPTMELVVLDGSSNGDQARATRDLPDQSFADGEVFTVTVDLWVTNPAPTGLILKEILPSGWTVSNALWNGSAMQPEFVNSEYRWLFGFGTPVSSGTLTYNTQASGSSGEEYLIHGVVAYLPEDTTVTTVGDQTVRLNATVDSDSDGMPDDWEQQFGLDPGDPTDAQDDDDSDGFSNLEEYLADTNPTNNTSRLLITDLQIQDDQAQLSWQGGEHAVQYVECTDNLISNDWNCVQVLSPPVSATNQVIMTKPSAQMYYRIRAAR